jgi:hypothetical protein
MIPLDDALRPPWLFGSTLHQGCERGGYYEQGEFAEECGSPLHCEIGMLGAGRAVQPGKAGMDERNRRMPQRGRHLRGVHDAGLSG